MIGHRLTHSADYNRAVMLTTEAQSLSDKILDARLSLTRLRQQSPSSRLTIPTATALLDTQAQQLQELDLSLQDLHKKLSGVKEKVKDGSREIERIRVEKGEVERTIREKQRDAMTEEDGRLVPLYDWCVLCFLPEAESNRITGIRHPFHFTVQCTASSLITPKQKMSSDLPTSSVRAHHFSERLP